MRKSPSIWNRINHREIETKLINLRKRLRGSHNELISQAVTDYCRGIFGHGKVGVRQKAMAGLPRAGEAEWRARLRAEMGFLRNYLSGAGQIYHLYFERLGIPLSSQALIEIWERGVRPQWEFMVQEQKNWFQIIYRSRPAETIDVRMREFASEAIQVHEDVLGSWSVKIEEAVSSETFRKVNQPASKRRGRPRGQTEGTLRLDREIRKIKRYLSSRPELSGGGNDPMILQICKALDTRNVPVYRALKKRHATNWVDAYQSSKLRSAVVQRISRV